MYLKSVTGTVKQTWLVPTALNIIEGDVSGALSIAAPRGSALSIPVPHAPTKNLCVIHVPFIITHGSPGSVVKHLTRPSLYELPPTSFVSDKEEKFKQFS